MMPNNASLLLAFVSGIFSLRFNLDISDFGAECVHLRYFVTDAEIQGCNIEHCGIDYFENGDGGKVGEGIYIGTSLGELDEDEASDACILSFPSALPSARTFRRVDQRVLNNGGVLDLPLHSVACLPRSTRAPSF